MCWQSVGAHSEQHTGPGHAEPALPSCCLSAAPWGLSPELPAISWGGGGGQVFGRSTGTSLHLHCHTPHTQKDQSSNQKGLSLRPGGPAWPPPPTGAPSLGLDGASTQHHPPRMTHEGRWRSGRGRRVLNSVSALCPERRCPPCSEPSPEKRRLASEAHTKAESGATQPGPPWTGRGRRPASRPTLLAWPHDRARDPHRPPAGQAPALSSLPGGVGGLQSSTEATAKPCDPRWGREVCPQVLLSPKALPSSPGMRGTDGDAQELW